MKKSMIIKVSAFCFALLLLLQPAAYAAGSASDKEIVKTYEAVLADPNESINYPAIIEENGKRYRADKRKNVLEVGDKRLVTENRTLTTETDYDGLKVKSTDGLDIPDTKEYSYLGTKYDLKLSNVTYEQKTITGRKVHLSQVVEYPKDIREPVPDETVDVEYTDADGDGETLTLQVPFSSLETVRGWHWESCTFNCTFNDYGNAYYKLYDKYIPHNAEKPQISGFESEVLRYLNLPDSSYRVLNANWNGEPSGNTRTALISAERRVAQFNAVYEGDVDLPDITRYTATAHYELEGVYPTDGKTYEYPATLTVTYIEKSSLVPVVLVSAGILCLALGLVLLLTSGAKKKKQREAVRQGMERYIR